LFTHDALTNKNQRTGLRWYSLRVEDEARGLNRADVILSVQELETIFYKYITHKKILTTYAAFSINPTPQADASAAYTILFLSGDNPHNQEGFIFFYNEVFHCLKKIYPKIKLIIGGSITRCGRITDMVIGDSNIELQGIVSDLYQFYSQADICINPVYNGTGIKMKTFEALSYGKILIAHPHSMIGVYDYPNVPVMLASTQNEYIEHINKVFSKDFDRISFKNNAINYMANFQKHVENQFMDALNS
jgi:glycosyltransferase involved in cell wall biosynthesis